MLNDNGNENEKKKMINRSKGTVKRATKKRYCCKTS